MNKFTLEYLVTLTANIYYWVFLLLVIISFFHTFTDEYKRIKEIKIKKGNYNNDDGATIIFITLFILSIYYK